MNFGFHCHRIFLISMLSISGLPLLHAQPTLQWVNTLGFTGNDIGYFCSVDAASNSYLCGTFVSTVDFDPGAGTFNLTSAGGADAYLAKYDPSGNLLWAVRWGSAGFENAYRLAVDAAGNVVVTGNFNGTVDFDPGAGTYNLTAGGSGDPYAVKFSPSGTFVWADAFTSGNGGLLYQPVFDLAGNVYLSGYYDTSVDADPGPGTVSYASAGLYDVFFGKYDVNGNHVWSGAIRSTGYDFGNTIAVDGAGNVYIAGGFSATADFDIGAGTVNLTSAGGQDIYFAKYNNSGVLQYARRMGGSGDDGSNHVMVDGSGNLYLFGRYNGTVDFDPGAGASNLTNLGGQDGYVAKYNSSGNYLFAFRLGGTGTSDVATCGAFSADGSSIYVKGNFLNTVDFDPGAGTVYRTANGTNTDLYFAKYTTAGAFVWVGVMGSTNIDNAYGVSADANGAIWVSGSFQLSVDFDVNAGVASRTSNGFADAYLAKYQDGIILQEQGHSIQVLPDANAAALLVSFEGDLPEGTLAWAERSTSTDPDSFRAIESLPGLPSTISDREIIPGMPYYYRIRFMDAEGGLRWSTMAEGMLPENINTLIYSNPSSDGCMHIASSDKLLNISIFDLCGRQVFTLDVGASPQNQSFETNLPSGTYFVRLHKNNGIQSQRWVIGQ